MSRHVRLKLEPLIIGGAQQQGLRAGTVPAFLCAGLGEAARIAREEQEADTERVSALKRSFLSLLKERVPGIEVNGSLRYRLPGNLNIRFPGVDGESLLMSLQGRVAASTGSACNAGLIEPSYVLAALGLSIEEINSSVRFGLSRFTRMEDVIKAAEVITDCVLNLRKQPALAV